MVPASSLTRSKGGPLALLWHDQVKTRCRVSKIGSGRGYGRKSGCGRPETVVERLRDLALPVPGVETARGTAGSRSATEAATSGMQRMLEVMEKTSDEMLEMKGKTSEKHDIIDKLHQKMSEIQQGLRETKAELKQVRDELGMTRATLEAITSSTTWSSAHHLTLMSRVHHRRAYPATRGLCQLPTRLAQAQTATFIARLIFLKWQIPRMRL